MPEIVLILWLPVTIAFMAVMYVCTLGAIAGSPQPIEEIVSTESGD